MAVLTSDQVTRLGKPPRPPPIDVRLVESDGRPTKAFADYLSAHHEWLRKLAAILAE